MTIRRTIIEECWCPQCNAGQMGNLHDITMAEKIGADELIGRKITCRSCGSINTLDDVLTLIPTSFLVNGTNKSKSNDELANWLNSEHT